MSAKKRLGPKSPAAFIFPERKAKETPEEYWTRVIRENLEKGTPSVLMAEILGRIIGNKEQREGVDELTGLKTKGPFWRDLEESLGLVRRFSRGDFTGKISLILLDLDDFKRENDRHGYLWGDAILKKVASILKNKRRASDIAVRWGGEEFCLILVGCPVRMAARIAEKLRRSIEKIGITASFGVAESKAAQEKPEDFFKRANVACAIAKGRIKYPSVKGLPKNRVVRWQPAMPKSLERKHD